MSTTTPFLSLLKPAGNELVSVVPQLNENYDKIDAELFEHDSRIGTVEGLAGVTGWLNTWNPTLSIGAALSVPGGAGATALAITETLAQHKLIGDQVFLDFDLTITSATQTYDVSANGLKFNLKLPYQMLNRSSAQGIAKLGAAVVGGTIQLGPGAMAAGATNLVLHAPRIQFESLVYPQHPVGGSDLEIPQNSIIYGSFSYRTNGVVVP